MPVQIAAFEIDEENAAKFAEHGLTEDQVLHVLDDAITVRRNRAGRRAQYLVIGRDHSGQCIAIPIEATDDPIVWRPVTAWHCKASEWARLPRPR